MPLNTIPIPFGLRDVKIKTFAAGTETPGAAIDFPNSRTFSFTETTDSEELRGDDGVVAVHDLGSGVDWELEGGGFSFEAVVGMYGGAVVTSGVTPNQVKTLTKMHDDVRPYFQVEGQALSDSGGDFHVTVFKCKATGELSGEMADGSFWLTGASGRGIGLTSNKQLYKIVQDETTTAIV